MKLLKFEIENVFAYDRKVVLDLNMTTPERNIILIWGRNGMGKTSFLNALKLLFVGSEGPEWMRRVGFPPRVLAPKQYVLGDGGGWSGVINSRIRHRSAAASEPVHARIWLQWLTSDGVTVTAERQWTEIPNGYRPSLSVWDGEQRLTGDPAELRLQDFMPHDFVPFFFFDGEDIKHLAESDERKTIDFDRLLRISFLDTLGRELKELAKERTRTDAANTLRVEITRAEEALTRARMIIETDGQRLTELDEKIASAQVELRRKYARREELSSGASDAQRSALEKRLNELKEDLGNEEFELAEFLPGKAPLIANLPLVEHALGELLERISAAGTEEQRLADRIRQALPGWLADEPLGLRSDAIEHIAARIARGIEELVAPSGPTGLFRDLELLRAEQIHRRLELVSLRGVEDRDNAVRKLNTVRRLRREITDTRDELLRLEVGSQANLEEYREIVARIGELEAEVASALETRGQLRARLREAEAEANQLVTRLKELRTRQEVELRRNQQSRFILKLAGTFEDLRGAVRKSARGRVEALINERFRHLAFGNELVDRIQIADDYTLTFFTQNGTIAGRSSLSSGIKQLAATAFLWAMKDAVGEDMSVAIDTPLGRLDRENQDQMLIHYYPRISSQVIVLPTDSEIDERKLELLRPHIAQQYRISNASGEGADIQKVSLIDEGT